MHKRTIFNTVCQPLSAQKGEIEFRKKLILHQIENENIFNDELSSDQIEKILQSRMDSTSKQINALQSNNIITTPYIEIGAERCQRSLMMENDLSSRGAALDISYHMLNSATYYKKVFNKIKVPLRICCNINNIPIKQNSVPFVFCYETLHHFPDPQPVINEIHRVLSPGGTFFFSEEPFKKVLHFNLYKSKKIYSPKSLSRNRIKKFFDYFFAEKSCNETKHGIIENENISLKEWKNALSIFNKKDISICSFRFLKSNLFNPKTRIKFMLVYLLGGEISGVCTKANTIPANITSIHDNLICPSCKTAGMECALIKTNNSLICLKCKINYPIINDIIFLLSYKMLNELYPEFAHR